MDQTTFMQLLAQLDDADWQALATGHCLQLQDDERLLTVPCNGANIILRAAPDSDAATLKREAMAAVEDLLDSYYRTTPLSQAGFNRQVSQLITQHGAAAFAAVPPARPSHTLFVDGGQVIAEPAGSPRHPYGAYCELERPLDGAAVEARVYAWLERGEAYARYLSMNVCRYNC